MVNPYPDAIYGLLDGSDIIERVKGNLDALFERMVKIW
jgi:hypothetical protein